MDKIDELLTRGVEKLYPSKEFVEKALRSGKKIRVYQGFDPSMPNLHLGNSVGLLKLKQFQDLGHEVIFLIGDFTGMIGDPTDKSATRVKLTREQTLSNAKNWKKQAEKILNFEDENPAKIIFNSSWSDKISFKDLIEITSNFTVQQMMERDFFQKRLKEEQPIYLHEFLYPVAQAIDSLEMDVDMEIGGSDQIFNMLAGRSLMKAVKGKEKMVLGTKLLVDAAGNKVGKTAGNALFLNAAPFEMYGGVMSFPDETITLGFELLTLVPFTQIDEVRKQLQSNEVNPMEIKKTLAFEIVKLYHGEENAKEASNEFENVFQNKEVPQETPSYSLKEGELGKDVHLVELLTKTNMVSSRGEAKRLIEQGAIDVNNKVIDDVNAQITLEKNLIIKIGKRKFLKIN